MSDRIEPPINSQRWQAHMLLVDAVLHAAERWLVTRPINYAADDEEMALGIAMRELMNHESHH